MSDINDLLLQTKTAVQQSTLKDLIQEVPKEKWRPAKRLRTGEVSNVESTTSLEMPSARNIEKQQRHQANQEMCHRLLRFVLSKRCTTSDEEDQRKWELNNVVMNSSASQMIEKNVLLDVPDVDSKPIVRSVAVAHATLVSFRRRLNVVADPWPITRGDTALRNEEVRNCDSDLLSFLSDSA